MAMVVEVKGEFRGVKTSEFNNETFYALSVEMEEETQRISCKKDVYDYACSKLKKGDPVKMAIKLFAREGNLKASFVRWAQ